MATNDSNLTALFKPFPLGRHQLKNRIVALPVFVGYALPNGHVSSFLIEHYRQLASSGAGLVVVANAAVSPDGMTSKHNLRIDDDEYLRGLTYVRKAIHQQGSLACLQLNHAGRFAKTDQPLLPSPIVGKDLSFNISSLKDFMEFFPLEQRFNLTQQLLSQVSKWGRPMSLKDIERVIADFGRAARRAYQAGFDMVELHGATGYLISQFLSAFTNEREDGFGGDLYGRVAFPLAIIKEMKRCLPPDFPIGFRLLLREWVPKGINLQEAISWAKMLEKEGIAYLSASAGTHNSSFSPRSRKKTARAGYLKEDMAELTAQLNTPTIISGRIIKPSLAARLLDEKTTDLIGLGRPLRVDSDWLKKAGKKEKTRMCINCGHCLRRVTQDQGFSCIQWPDWKQQRTELEQKMLTRSLYRSLYVIAGGRDVEIFRHHFQPFTTAGKRSSDTMLFLKSESEENFFTEKDYDLLTWCKGFYAL
ncbi:MAG: NADH:flavin oxidoreductase, partial [bacterium]|nr:NADH:flavin oxidoreductase [bacterium]